MIGFAYIKKCNSLAITLVVYIDYEMHLFYYHPEGQLCLLLYSIIIIIIYYYLLIKAYGN